MSADWRPGLWRIHAAEGIGRAVETAKGRPPERKFEEQVGGLALVGGTRGRPASLHHATEFVAD
jgi:hypothetical protein